MSAYYTRRDYKREYANVRGRSRHSTTGTFCSLLMILFVAFKLSHIINWNWKWVLGPIWIPGALYLTLAIVAAGLQEAVDHFERKALSAKQRSNMARGFDVKSN